MEAMKEALKRKMMNLKGDVGHHDYEHEPMLHHSEHDEAEMKDELSAEHQMEEEDPKKEDLAPELDVDDKSEAHEMLAHEGLSEMEHGDAEMHPHELLAAKEIASRHSPHNSKGSLHERAAAVAKHKLGKKY